MTVSSSCTDEQTLPALQRSAISRQNTLIIVPSYFDFVRLTDYLRRSETKISHTSISEYSSNSEISRARTTFFKGKKDFLIVTERFHFYRRYKLRGAKTLMFYSLPEHAQFYAEFATTPFLPSRKEGGEEEADVDVEDVSTRVLFSRFDALRLERVVGSKDARRMLSSGEDRFVFA
jgi:U3 small nucleolar RNA-associated protein 25